MAPHTRPDPRARTALWLLVVLGAGIGGVTLDLVATGELFAAIWGAVAMSLVDGLVRTGGGSLDDDGPGDDEGGVA